MGSQSRIHDPMDSLVSSFPLLRSSVVRDWFFLGGYLSAALHSEKTLGRGILL